jgi:hypothetical protein
MGSQEMGNHYLASGIGFGIGVGGYALEVY